MTDADLAALIAARKELPALLTTVAPESVTPEQVAALTQGRHRRQPRPYRRELRHGDDYAEAGATMVTHLFNAMSQIGNREPGLVGAALDDGTLSAGLIADGIHVDPATIEIAVRAKCGPGSIFLVTDAMATIGTDMTSFTLNGRTIYRKDGRLTLADGTLAGADLDMISAVRFMCGLRGSICSRRCGWPRSIRPQAIGRQDRLGRLTKGAAANIVALSDKLDVRGVWIDGEQVFSAPDLTASQPPGR